MESNTQNQRKEKMHLFFLKQKKEFIKNKNIVIQLVKRNVKVQYRNSVIGVAWTILNPLLNMLVMFFVFGSVLGYSANDPTYALYILCGNIIFSMMRGATVQSLPCLVSNRGLLTKNKIAFKVFPLACNLSAVINFFFSLIALLGVMVVVALSKHVSVFSVNIFMTIIMLPALFLFCYGMSLILCAIYVFFRDIMHFYNVFLTLWMYLTPIFYKLDRFSNNSSKNIFEAIFINQDWSYVVKAIINLNPMYHFVEYFRAIVYAAVANPAYSFPKTSETFLLYGIGIGFTVIGTLVFNVTKRKFIFNI